MTTAGLLLAAGAGRRFGMPKALARDHDGDGVATGPTWGRRAANVLLQAGCEPVHVAVGARGEEVAALLPPGVRAVPVLGWEEGMGASIRAGLLSLVPTPAPAVLVLLVDLPGVGEVAVRRLLAHPTSGTSGALVRATYAGVPGHPVVLGRDRWADVVASARGDRGARDYLQQRTAEAVGVECGDVADPRDVDAPA